MGRGFPFSWVVITILIIIIIVQAMNKVECPKDNINERLNALTLNSRLICADNKLVYAGVHINTINDYKASCIQEDPCQVRLIQP